MCALNERSNTILKQTLTYLCRRICSIFITTAPAQHTKCWIVGVLVMDWFPIVICRWKGTSVLSRMSCQANGTASCRLLRHWLPTLVSTWTNFSSGNIIHSLSRLHYCRLVSLSPYLKIIPITETEIKSIIHSLKPKKIIKLWWSNKENIKSLCIFHFHQLSYIYSHSLFTGIFPDCLNIAIVKPFCKNGAKTSMTNYRPISLVKVFTKAF